jgi:NTE family protein
LRAISFVGRLMDQSEICSKTMKRMHIHSIAADEVMAKLGHAGKLNADWHFLSSLRVSGRMHAEAWLAQNFGSIGRSSSVDIRNVYL